MAKWATVTWSLMTLCSSFKVLLWKSDSTHQIKLSGQSACRQYMDYVVSQWKCKLVSSRLVISCNGIVCHKYQAFTRQQDRRKGHLEQELKRNLEEKITVFTWMQDKSLTMIPNKNTSAKKNCTYLNPSTNNTSAQKNIFTINLN
jgi:hypothetical protein